MNWTLAELFSAYRGRNPRFRAEWPERGVAVVGDFAGIQKYVLRPVPGAKAAAKRLRGRSLTVVALTQLAAEETRRRMGVEARVFYATGGRFLVVTGTPESDWRERLEKLRGEMDAYFQEEFRGETIFHLAGMAFTGRKIPHEALSRELQKLRARPLAAALMDDGGWKEEAFWRQPGNQAFRCPACLETADEGVVQPDEDGTKICVRCDRDKQLGGKLAGSRRPCLREAADGEIGFLGKRFTVDETGEQELDIVHHLPRVNGKVASFEEIAERAAGARKYLGYLRLDADHVGEAFRRTEGDPEKTLALSRFLQGFFCGRVQEFLTLRYPWIYPVYGGGDDLFVIGPWDSTLEFAAGLREELRKLVEVSEKGETKELLQFSAAVELAKPGQHILTKAEAAEDALTHKAKKDRGSIHVLGETVKWSAFQGMLNRARKVVGWRDREQVPAAFLRDLMRLHQLKHPRWKAMLHYQVARNLDARRAPEAWQWAQELLHNRGEKDWERVEFFVRYAMLASKEKEESDGR